MYIYQYSLYNSIQKKPVEKWTDNLNRHFRPKKHTYGQKAHEKMPNIIKEMQIKAIMRYHLIPVRMAFIKKSTNSKYL